MKIAVLGTGEVGRSIATGLLRAGHTVTIAGRSQTSDGAQRWLTEARETAGAMTASSDAPPGDRIAAADFTSAAKEADLIFLCVSGSVAVDVARTVGDAVSGKVVVDVTNPLTFPEGQPMELSVANTDSLGETIQRTLPSSLVVKALNTVNSHIMTHPRELNTTAHILPIAGNDETAKRTVRTILERDFGWERVVDLGDIAAARGMESYLHLWLRLWSSLGHARFNIAIVE